jgi:hypothetical protein
LPLNSKELTDLADAGIIDQPTADRIAEFFDDAELSSLSLDLTNSAYLLGSIVVIWAMGWFMGESFDRYGGFVLMVTAVAYSIVFNLTANTLWHQPKLRIPGGILFTFGACMIPVAVFGVLSGFGWWPEFGPDNRVEAFRSIRLPRLIVETSGIIAAFAMMRARPFALLALPVAFALWGMSIDVAVLMTNPTQGVMSEWVNFEITFIFGLAVIGAGYLADQRTKADYSLFLYISGLMSVWGALTLKILDSPFYPGAAVLMLATGILLQRSSFGVFGVLGILFYLGYLAAEVFAGSVLFPLALVAIGVGIIGSGVWYRTHKKKIEEKLVAAIPVGLRSTLPRYR